MKKLFLLKITSFLALLLCAVISQAVVIQPPVQATFDKTTTGTIPDLNQNRDFTVPPDGIIETKWCAPTASADSVWYFGKGSYPLLIPAGANDSAKADSLITTLGGLMGTSDAAGGTTIINCVNGLQVYYNSQYPATFNVSLVTAWTMRDDTGAPSAVNLWNWMATKLHDCNDVLPIISFGGGAIPPTSENDIMDLPLDSASGHLVMMIGYDFNPAPNTITVYDPDDDATGNHAFPMGMPAPVAVTSNVAPVGFSAQGTALSLAPDGQSPPYIVGAIISGPQAQIVIDPEMKPYLRVDSMIEWQEKLSSGWPDAFISPMTPTQWIDYFGQLQGHCEEGEPYPTTTFMPPELYVYEGGSDGNPSNDPDPEDAGLVMKWGDIQTPSGGEYASAWKYDYGLDPDLSNAIITVQASPPGPSGITQISLGMQDANGNIRSWWWNVPAFIPYGPPPTTVTIDTSKTGIAATNPVASGYANNPAFNIQQVQQIIADENATWVASVGVPAPGQTAPGLWNYWHNLSVTPKLPGGGADSKWFVKYSQPPVEIEAGLINGWDEVSIYEPERQYPIMADDWECKDERPVTDIHWWGSFKGWTQPYLPPILPRAFRIGIWTDVPDLNPGNPADSDWSHPGTLIWENVCTTAVWNFAGYDVDPRLQEENETCFQWAQFLSQDEWFHQKPMEGGIPNVYWLSISAEYPAGTDFTSPDFYPWGWKTRPHHFNDDAVRIFNTADGLWPPKLNSTVTMENCVPVEWPLDVESWDLAFELTTNEPAYKDNPIPGDITGPAGVPDKVVDLLDFALMASNWLKTAP